MNTLRVEPYLFFGGRCEEALEFYRTAIGARIEMISRFSESPDPPPAGMLPPGFENKIMHSSFRIGSSLLMASDGCGQPDPIGGFSLSLTVNTGEEADRLFNALAVEGKVIMPLATTFWSPRFGIVEDRFGVSWMINLETAGQTPVSA